MGYYIHLSEQSFHLKKENFVPALEAIKNEAQITLARGGHWSWMDMEDVLKFNTLIEFLEYAGWPAELGCLIERIEGDIVALDFSGEKIGSEESFFQILAPYIEPNSYLEVIGEDSDRWRWSFNGKELECIQCVLDWEGKCDAFDALIQQVEILPPLLGIHPSLDIAIEKALKTRGKK